MVGTIDSRLCDFGYATSTGVVRDSNEDNAAVIVLPDAPIGKCILAIVADGMGGHQSGEIASALCVNIIIEHLRSCAGSFVSWDPVREALNEALHLAHTRICAYASAEGSNLGTTATVAVYCGGEVEIAHVGDSRAYLIANSIQLITDDDTLIAEQVRNGEMTAEEARSSSQRNVLTQALTASINFQTHFYHMELPDGACLLLCSDGLHGVVEPQSIWRIMQSSPGARSAAENLVAAANAAGGPDNITAVCLWTGERRAVRRQTTPMPVYPYGGRRKARKFIPMLYALLIAVIAVGAFMAVKWRQSERIPTELRQTIGGEWKLDCTVRITKAAVDIECDPSTRCTLLIKGKQVRCPADTSRDDVHYFYTGHGDIAAGPVKLEFQQIKGGFLGVTCTPQTLITGFIDKKRFSQRFQNVYALTGTRRVKVASVAGSTVGLILEPAVGVKPVGAVTETENELKHGARTAVKVTTKPKELRKTKRFKQTSKLPEKKPEKTKASEIKKNVTVKNASTAVSKPAVVNKSAIANKQAVKKSVTAVNDVKPENKTEAQPVQPVQPVVNDPAPDTGGQPKETPSNDLQPGAAN